MKPPAFISFLSGPRPDERRGTIAAGALRPGRLIACLGSAVALITVLAVFARSPAATADAPPLPVPGGSANCDVFTVKLFGIIDFQREAPGWTWVDDTSRKLEDVSGVVRESVVSHTDFPAVHDSHDQIAQVEVDPKYKGLLSDVNDPGRIEAEWEIGTFPSEVGGDPPERTFPRWAWPSVGDRVWMNGNWIFDCGHAEKSLGFNRYRTEIHPPRAIASMRQQVHALPGTGSTPVPVTATDLYIHGRAGFVGDDLACGQEIIIDLGSCTPSPYPHRPTPIDAEYNFTVCLPPKPSANAVPDKSMELGPGNTIGVDPTTEFNPAKGPCAGPDFGPIQLDVKVPLENTGVSPDDVLARKIYAGWDFPATGLRHVTVKLTRGALHNDMELPTGDCECSFFWLNMDRAPDEWYRLTPYQIPTDDDCLFHTNTLNHWDDSRICGNGLLNFSGPTFDFYVAAGQDYTLRTVAYDQDCADDFFGSYILGGPLPDGGLGLTLDGVLFIACYMPPFDFGENDPYAPVTAINLPAGSNVDVPDKPTQFQLRFDVTNEPLTAEDTADLSLVKGCAPALARAGKEITCTIVVTNPGPGLPRTVVVQDTLLTAVAPSNYTIDMPTFTFSGGGSSASCGSVVVIAGGKQFECNLGTVPVGGSATITYHLTSHVGGNFSNNASVTTDSTDPNPGNNSGHSSLHVDAELTVTANNQSRLFGQPNPPLTYTITGFVGGDTQAVVSGSAACTTTATQFSPAGLYPITCTVGTLSAPNYVFTKFIPGTLTVTYTSPCLTGTHTGPLTVSSGQAICIGAGGTQTGPITVSPGGSLDLEGGRITGPLTSTGAAVIRLCGATLTGPLTISGSTGLVLVGGDAATGPCAPNMIVGAITLTGNKAGVEFNGNRVVGPVTITGNTGSLPPPDAGPVHAVGNTVTGPVNIQP